MGHQVKRTGAEKAAIRASVREQERKVAPSVFPAVGDEIEVLLDGRLYTSLKIEQILWTDERRLVPSETPSYVIPSEVSFAVPYMLIGTNTAPSRGHGHLSVLWSHVSSWQRRTGDEPF